MSQLIIPGLGAVVGGIIGGPFGASLGWTLGASIQASRQEIRQDSIGDLRIQTSQYGVNIPVVVGQNRVVGFIFWGTDKTTYEIKSRAGKGSGPEIVTYGYKINLAIGICKGPILGIRKVWADEKLIVDASVDAKPLIGTLYLGTNTQMPDPTMTSFLGAGNVPAYRGLAYIVLNDFDLGVSGRVPQFSFEVIHQGGI